MTYNVFGGSLNLAIFIICYRLALHQSTVSLMSFLCGCPTILFPSMITKTRSLAVAKRLCDCLFAMCYG